MRNATKLLNMFVCYFSFHFRMPKIIASLGFHELLSGSLETKKLLMLGSLDQHISMFFKT